MQTRTQPKGTGQQAVNFGPKFTRRRRRIVDRSSVGPLGRSFLGAAGRRRPTLARRHRVGNLYRVIHRILVRGLEPVPSRLAPTTERNFPISPFGACSAVARAQAAVDHVLRTTQSFSCSK